MKLEELKTNCLKDKTRLIEELKIYLNDLINKNRYIYSLEFKILDILETNFKFVKHSDIISILEDNLFTFFYINMENDIAKLDEPITSVINRLIANLDNNKEDVVIKGEIKDMLSDIKNAPLFEFYINQKEETEKALKRYFLTQYKSTNISENEIEERFYNSLREISKLLKISFESLYSEFKNYYVNRVDKLDDSFNESVTNYRISNAVNDSINMQRVNLGNELFKIEKDNNIFTIKNSLTNECISVEKDDADFIFKVNNEVITNIKIYELVEKIKDKYPEFYNLLMQDKEFADMYGIELSIDDKLFALEQDPKVQEYIELKEIQAMNILPGNVLK